jgi:hypothetical protein
VARMGDIKALMGFCKAKAERKRPLGRSTLRLEDNVKMCLQKVRWGGAWTGLI